jgi:two-component system sensor histidine kinase FlrB
MAIHPLMPPPEATLDAAQLRAAFALFSRSSEQLIATHQSLEKQVTRLSGELASANAALTRELAGREALLAALPAGVVALDANGRVAEANPAARRMLGGAAPGESWDELLAGRPHPGDNPSTWIDAHGTRISLAESPLPEGGRLMLLHDIDEVHRLQQDLAHKQRLAAMGEMAAKLAHQLRTPLATALLYTSHLGRAGLGDAERERFSAKATSQLKHLERLIADMLAFVRGQALARESFGTHELAHAAAQTLEPQMRGQHIDFELRIEGENRCIVGEHKALLGVLTNLLDNAMLAAGSRGQVSLDVRSTSDGARIAVADNGPGMSSEVLARVFEPFFTTRAHGTGLGLAIARNVVEQHGGSIHAESISGQGSRFIVELPAASLASEPSC